MVGKPRSWIMLLMALALCACQAGTPAPAKTAATPLETATAAAPTQRAATATPSASATPAFTATPTVPPELLVEEAALKGQEVRFWHPLGGEAAAQLERLVKQFNLTNTWGIRVTLSAAGGDEPLLGLLDQASDEQRPDALLALSEDIAYLHQTGDLPVDLNFYLNSTPWGLSKEQRDGFTPLFLKQDQSGKAQLGLPALRTARGLLYNKTFAAELKFNASPATSADLLAQTCAAAKANNQFLASQGTGGWMVDTHPLTALSWFGAFGAAVIPANEGDPWKFEQPGALSALRYMRELQEKGCLWVPKNPTPQIYFGERKALLYTATLRDVFLQNAFQKKGGLTDEWAFLPFPGSNAKPVMYAYGYSYSVLRSTPARQMAAWLFVRWMSQGDVQARLAGDWPSLPVSQAMRAELAARADGEPWQTVLALESLQAAPSLASWRFARRPLEDAFWQVFNVASADQLNQILPYLDAMTADLLRPAP